MVQENCFGRECKVGWGYNESADQLTSFDSNLPITTSKADNCWWYYVFETMSDNVLCWVSLHLTIQPLNTNRE